MQDDGERTTREALEASIAACYSTWAETYFDDYYGDQAPYPPVHAEVILEEFRRAGSTRLLDAGCGPASFLQHIADHPIEWHGFDVTPEMVDEAIRRSRAFGRPEAQVWSGSVLTDGAFSSPTGDLDFDSAILVGVLPHIPKSEDAAVLRRMSRSVSEGGLLIAEARNALFGLFTLNRYSAELFNTLLIDWDRISDELSDGSEETLSRIRSGIEERFRMDLPPVRRGGEDAPGYDEVLSRTHVPFELASQASTSGWVDVRIRYVHQHAVPPMFEHLDPGAFRRASLAAEDPDDWRGVVRASSFLVIGRRG